MHPIILILAFIISWLLGLVRAVIVGGQDLHHTEALINTKGMRYHQLVRDNDPSELRRRKAAPVVQVLTDDQYRLALNRRLQEQASGYHQDKSLEQLTDLLEVIYAIATLRGATPEQLDALRQRKARQKGGYSQRYFLIETNE